jgi:hypothetical protein
MTRRMRADQAGGSGSDRRWYPRAPPVLISIRVFDSADEALATNEIPTNWLRNNALEFTKGMPEVMAGNALVAEFKNQ